MEGIKIKDDLILINKLKNHNLKCPEILICSGSPEERCKGIPLKLDNKYYAENIFLLKYSEGSKKREQNYNEMKNILNNYGNITEFIIYEDQPIPMIQNIIKNINYIKKQNVKLSITIDTSTIIKWHTLFLIKILDLLNLLDITRFLYTEPNDYHTDLIQPLSFGMKKIFALPGFVGNYDFTKELLLVLMLGYEGSRAKAIFENTDPDECLLLIAKPAYHEEWEGRTEEMNRELINILGENKIDYIKPRNPILVAKKLKKILGKKKYENYNIFISPLGTKPQTLALYSYLGINSTNTTIIYGAPYKYNQLFYSTGIGDSWILPFRVLSK